MSENNQLAVVRQTLTKMEGEFKAVLPPQIPVEKFCRTMMTAIQMAPDLLEADRKSLFATGMKAAQDGLLLDGREAAAVIFNKKNGNSWDKHVQYMPMVGGILKKLRNSGELVSISANVVFENDTFEFELGDEERITHKPLLRGKRGDAIGAYAIAKLNGGGIVREFMSLEEIEKVRSVSRSKDRGPWSDWWEEMAKKTVIRRICKRLPSSADVDSVLENDNETYDLSHVQQRQLPQAVQEINNSLALPVDSAPVEAEVEATPVDVLPTPPKPKVKPEPKEEQEAQSEEWI